MNSKLFYLSMILISSLGYLSSVLISRFQIHFNGCPFFRVHIKEGLNLYHFSLRKRAGGHARKIAVSNSVMKYFEGFIGITEERNQSYGDASADWKTPVYFVPLPLYLKIRLRENCRSHQCSGQRKKLFRY
jgi:hypothetical protein